MSIKAGVYKQKRLKGFAIKAVIQELVQESEDKEGLAKELCIFFAEQINSITAELEKVKDEEVEYHQAKNKERYNEQIKDMYCTGAELRAYKKGLKEVFYNYLDKI